MSEPLESTQGQVSSPDRRAHARRRPNSLTYIEIDKENGGIVLDACEGGVSVQAVVRITEEFPQIRLKLHDSNDWLEMRTRVIWTRESRKVAGLQFEELSDQFRVQLNDWLSRDASANASEVVDGAAPAIETEAIQTKATEAEAVETAAVKIDAAETDAAQTEPTETEAIQTEAVQTETAPTEAVDSNAGPASSESETKPEPAPTFVADPSASDSWEPGLPEALEDFVPDAPILTAPLTFGQETEAQIEKRETHPARMLQAKRATVSARAEDELRVSSVYLLLFVLALVSLTAGWAAGHGKFGSAIQNFHGLFQSKAPAAPTLAMRAGTPTTPVNEIEIVDASNQRWVVPLHAPVAKIAPVRAHQAPERAPAPAPTPALNFQIWTLSAPKGAGSSNVEDVAPPAVNDRQGVPQIAPLGAGPVAPTGYTVPIPEPGTGELKRGALVHQVEPEYPALARNQRVSGTVVLEADVSPDGAIRSLKVVSGPQLLIPAAINAVRQWRYAPTLLDGKPIETQARISLVFHLPSGGQ